MTISEWLLGVWERHRTSLSQPVRTLSFPQTGQVFEDRPYQLAIINLSQDSHYRESIVSSVGEARQRARELAQLGAAMVDVGAESTVQATAVVRVGEQIDALRPVVRALADDGILVSTETYHPEVAEAVLDAGSAVINLTGRIDDPAFYEAIARHQAGVILCYTPGRNARSRDELPSLDALIDEQLKFFRERIELAASAGVERIWVDPGIGFDIVLPEGPERIRIQTAMMLQSFRFRELGWPVCVSLPTMTMLFGDEYRVAETGVAAISLLGTAGLLRTHEVARVQPVIDLFEIGAG